MESTGLVLQEDNMTTYVVWKKHSGGEGGGADWRGGEEAKVEMELTSVDEDLT